jgi:SHS2 domain-containing protein
MGERRETRSASAWAAATGTARWEHFGHDADIGVRGCGSTPAEAFAQAALAMTAVITEPASVKLVDAVTIESDARTLDLLLYRWLNALVFEMATRGLLFGQFEVTINGLRLTGIARGEKVDRARHAPAVEVKGATLTELAVVEKRPGRWMAQCVVDV